MRSLQNMGKNTTAALQMISTASTAARGSINTPSYSQVVQPLYKQASGRWTHYRKQMDPVLPVLQPWIEAFGY